MTEQIPNAYPSATQVAHVRHDGSLLAGPSGWTSERTDTGHYTVHHRMGSEAYIVMAQTLILPDQPAAFAAVTEEKSDYFCFRVFDVDGGDASHDVQLVVTV